jgi:hypothetical protein
LEGKCGINAELVKRLEDIIAKLESERGDWVNAQLESKEVSLMGFFNC